MTASSQAEAVLELLIISLGTQTIQESCISRTRQLSITVPPTKLHDVVKSLVKDGMQHLSAITGIHVNQHIELLYHFIHKTVVLTLKIKLSLPNPTILSLASIIPGVTLYEREIYEMLGVQFDQHPNLRPLLLPEQWPPKIYPLRKDFSLDDLQNELARSK